MEVCKICNREFNNRNGLSRHLIHSHKISVSDYRRAYLNSEEEELCPYCKTRNRREFNGGWNLRETCDSEECISKIMSRRGKIGRSYISSERMSEIMKNKWQDEDYRSKQSSSMSKFWNSEEGKKLSSSRNEKVFANPLFRDKIINNAREMNKARYSKIKDSKEEYVKFRESLANSYISRNGIVTTYIYLMERGDEIKVGITRDLNKRAREEKAEVIESIKLNSVCASYFENKILIDNYEFLISRNIKSEWFPIELKDNILEYFNQIKH